MDEINYKSSTKKGDPSICQIMVHSLIYNWLICHEICQTLLYNICYEMNYSVYNICYGTNIIIYNICYKIPGSYAESITFVMRQSFTIVL